MPESRWYPRRKLGEEAPQGATLNYRNAESKSFNLDFSLRETRQLVQGKCRGPCKSSKGVEFGRKFTILEAERMDSGQFAMRC